MSFPLSLCVVNYDSFGVGFRFLFKCHPLKSSLNKDSFNKQDKWAVKIWTSGPKLIIFWINFNVRQTKGYKFNYFSYFSHIQKSLLGLRLTETLIRTLFLLFPLHFLCLFNVEAFNFFPSAPNTGAQSRTNYSLSSLPHLQLSSTLIIYCNFFFESFSLTNLCFLFCGDLC